MLDVNPLRAHLRQWRNPNRHLRPVRHDCPCAASSFLSVALAKALRTALGGRGQENQQLADRTIPLEATVTPLRARGGSNLVRQLFEPGDTRSGSRSFPGCEFTRHLGCQSLRRVATRRQLPAAGSAVASLCADPRARLAQALLHRHPRDRKAEATVIAPIPHIRVRRNIILCLQPEVCVPSIQMPPGGLPAADDPPRPFARRNRRVTALDRSGMSGYKPAFLGTASDTERWLSG
jgi:hypothetical protein